MHIWPICSMCDYSFMIFNAYENVDPDFFSSKLRNVKDERTQIHAGIATG